MSVTDEKIMSDHFDAKSMQRALQLARDTLIIEANAIMALQQRLLGEQICQAEDSSSATSPPGTATNATINTSNTSNTSHAFLDALQLLLKCNGRVVVSGMGKSGHIARKISATLASTGTPALFMHPGEAAHGDLGMITAQDVLIAISNSGETAELVSIVPIVKRMGAGLISMTGNPHSSLAQLSDVHLDVSVEQEACPLNLAPTASTTATLALGDALAVAALDARGFRAEDFARSHPGGALGRRLLTHVHDVMRSGEAIPKVSAKVSLQQALLEITRKGMAMTAIVDEQNTVLGVFTDGDLRRLFEQQRDISRLTIEEVMRRDPHCIRPDQLAVDAVALMEQFRINQLLVKSADGKLLAALHIHDLTRAKVI